MRRRSRYCAGARTGSSATPAEVSSVRLISSMDRPLVSKPTDRNINAACASQKAGNNKAGNSAEGTPGGEPWKGLEPVIIEVRAGDRETTTPLSDSNE